MITLEYIVDNWYDEIVLGRKGIVYDVTLRGIVDTLNTQGYKFTVYTHFNDILGRSYTYITPENQEALDFIAAGKMLRRLQEK